MSAPTVAVTAPGATRASHGLWRDALRRLIRNKPAVLGMVCIAIFITAAILAPVIAPYGPLAGSLADRYQPPNAAHLLGTDTQGRDELTRILYGAQVSLQVGVLLAIPGILLAIGIIAWLDRGLLQLMLAIAVTYVPIFARLLRGSLLALRESDYVTAARSIGASRMRILLRHMLPNALTPVIVAGTLVLATAIIDIAGLGFLGLGPPDPRTAEWGTMLTDARKFLTIAPWLVYFPGLAIVISAIGFNLLGDGLRDSLDPRLRR